MRIGRPSRCRHLLQLQHKRYTCMNARLPLHCSKVSTVITSSLQRELLPRRLAKQNHRWLRLHRAWRRFHCAWGIRQRWCGGCSWSNAGEHTSPPCKWPPTTRKTPARNVCLTLTAESFHCRQQAATPALRVWLRKRRVASRSLPRQHSRNLRQAEAHALQPQCRTLVQALPRRLKQVARMAQGRLRTRKAFWSRFCSPRLTLARLLRLDLDLLACTLTRRGHLSGMPDLQASAACHDHLHRA